MSPVQDALVAAAVSRLEKAGTPPGGHRSSVAVVVDMVAPEPFIRGVIGFTLQLPRDAGVAWNGTFTRTIFLAGRPSSVRLRHPDAYATVDDALAWYGPGRDSDLGNVSRLLQAFRGPAPIEAPAGPLTLRVPGPDTGVTARAAIATGGISTADYLVHVHHLFAEATLRGLVRPGDTVRVEHREELDTPWDLAALAASEADRTQTRITYDRREPDRRDSDRLRLYAVLRSNRKERRTCTPTAS